MRVLQLMLLGLIFCSCSSENSYANSVDPNQEQTDGGNESGKLLRSMQSDNKTVTYSYNGDSALKSIITEMNGRKHSEAKFIYKNGKITEKTYKDAYNKSEVKAVIEYKGDLVAKQTYYQENEVVAIEEYFYNENNQMVKQIQKLEWNNEATKQERVIDIIKVPGKNEVQLKYNGDLAFIVTYDDTKSPYAKIKGYSALYTSHFHGISNNVLSFKRVYKNGNEDSQTTELSFDSKREYLLETTKTDNDKRLICKEVYSYK